MEKTMFSTVHAWRAAHAIQEGGNREIKLILPVHHHSILCQKSSLKQCCFLKTDRQMTDRQTDR